MVDGSNAKNLSHEPQAGPLYAESPDYAYNLAIAEVLNYGRGRMPWWFWAGKRTFDIVFSALLLLCTWPLFLVIAVAIKWETKGPVFFIQPRVGERLRIFPILKFRTMVVTPVASLHRVWDEDTNSIRRPRLHEDRRITKVGRVLRRWSLDELPQLVNILRGDLSFVGPRPLCLEESLNTKPTWLKRYSVPAGLSGLTQISMRGASHSAETWGKDLEYISQLSIKQEISILWRTLFALKDNY